MGVAADVWMAEHVDSLQIGFGAALADLASHRPASPLAFLAERLEAHAAAAAGDAAADGATTITAAAADDADAEGEVAYMQSHMDAIEAALSDAVRAAAASMPESDRALSFMAAQIRNYKDGGM